MADNEPRGEQNPHDFSTMIKKYGEVNLFLQKSGANPILYGSVGVAVYLGDFKEFEDLDLLVEDRWLNENWSDFVNLLVERGFKLIDVDEHEFEDKNKFKVNFSSYSILVRDKIADPEKDTTNIMVQGVEIKTLKPEFFLKAYEFSVKDGYREKTRGKKDAFVIERLKTYLDTIK